MRTDVQIRYSVTEFDIRSAGDGNTLIGHAAIFNSETVIASMFREMIAPRAFRKSIKESDVRALFNHNPDVVLGRNKAGTLRLKEDEQGLAYEIDLPDTQAARDLWTSIDRGDISQSSFAFSIVKELHSEPDEEAGETMPLYTVKEARLFDVSPVTYPAYEDTEVTARCAYARIAAACERPLDEVIEAAKAGELSRLWIPRSESATTEEPPTEPPTIDEHSRDTLQPEPRKPFPIYL